jgi:choline dehydrogenase-like flavoprotein
VSVKRVQLWTCCWRLVSPLSFSLSLSLSAMLSSSLLYSLAKDDKLTDRGIVGSTVSGFAFHSLESYLSKEEVQEIHRQIDQGDTTDWNEGMKETNRLQLDKWLSNKAPAMEQILIPGFFTSDGAPKDGAGYLTSVVALQYPFSRGTVHVASSDVDAPPIIDPKYFSNNADLQLMALSLKHVIESVEKGPLKDIVLDLHTPSHDKYKTVKDYEEYIKNFTGTTYHPVGTCSMMSKEKGGVVDSNLRVYGTSNVRVADASILPVMPSGHILSACYVVGVKGETHSLEG